MTKSSNIPKGLAGGATGAASNDITSNTADSIKPLEKHIRAVLLGGGAIRVLDFKPEQHQAAIGILAKLGDELPIKCRWETVRESHLSQTRLRVKTYRIPGEFLREVAA